MPDFSLLYDVQLPDIEANNPVGPWSVTSCRRITDSAFRWAETTHVEFAPGVISRKNNEGTVEEGAWALERNATFGPPLFGSNFLKGLPKPWLPASGSVLTKTIASYSCTFNLG